MNLYYVTNRENITQYLQDFHLEPTSVLCCLGQDIILL
jgi:hypothetical protein